MAKDFAPWSAETAQGIKTDPVDSNIKVRQEVVPAVTVGTINAVSGEWVGVPTSDEIFYGNTTHLLVANGAAVLAPANNVRNHIDMTGFNDIILAIKPTNGGNVAITAVMGPSTIPFANLSPVNAATTLRSNIGSDSEYDFNNTFDDAAESMTADVWNIYYIRNQVKNQKNLQFKFVNNSGGESSLEIAFMRLV
jgi:hypothetical protein